MGSCFFAVKWNNVISLQFDVRSGVRQGSCLSPAIFNAFMDGFVVELKTLDLRCHVSQMFVGCLLHADGIILLSSHGWRSSGNVGQMF